MLNLMLACMQPISEPILETPDTQDTAKPQEDCTNGMDDDGDGQVDCADSDCDWQPICSEDCQDGVDNDLDGLVDCEDGDCALGPPCSEDCYSSEDDDDDGLKNCEDDDCWAENICGAFTMQLQGGRLQIHGESRDQVRNTWTNFLGPVVYSFSSGSTYTVNSWQWTSYELTNRLIVQQQFQDLSGTIRREQPDGVASTCNWAMDLETHTLTDFNRRWHYAKTKEGTPRSYTSSNNHSSSPGGGHSSAGIPSPVGDCGFRFSDFAWPDWRQVSGEQTAYNVSTQWTGTSNSGEIAYSLWGQPVTGSSFSSTYNQLTVRDTNYQLGGSGLVFSWTGSD